MVDKEKIKQLVEKYYSLEKEGELKDYNEEATKKSFIEPLFHALGWDIENLKEVSVEETIKNKRVDYGFRIGGIPKFFLEAKALREEDIIQLKYVQQAIDYAWMKSCTWAVLTNFRTLIVYNAEQKSPDPRMNWFIKFTDPKEYLERIDTLMLLSRDSVKSGDLDKKAEEFGKKELKKSIDKALLDDITNFREMLYNNIKKNNQNRNLSSEEIEESVQRIIDRLIFIRNTEDRGLESEELRSKLREWSGSERGHLLNQLNKLYSRYDDDYDSRLFEHSLCDELSIDDDILEEVITGLYESKDKLYRYDFSLISADILGNIYEQYLGRILKKVGKTNKLEASKAKRKSEGIYYTPTYIVEYIVKNTLGEYIKTHSEKDIENVKILDPACGSGSFLLKAYDTLENYWKEKGKLDQSKLEERGSYSKKVDIARNNIFGVDLDEKAVEIAQLNLLLKIAEKRKRLPELRNNIKCGNSLIDDPKVASDKAFNWDEEFTEMTGSGGFDVVIGNPPYINIYKISKNKKEIEFYQRKFEIAYKKFDLYILFMEKSIKLIKDGGRFSFIVPDKWLYLPYGEKLRAFILQNCIIEKIVDLTKFKVFKDAVNTPIIFILRKEKNNIKRDKNKIQIILPKENAEDILINNNDTFVIHQKIFEKTPKNMFRIQLTDKALSIIEKVDAQSLKLGEICYVNWGCRPVPLDKFYVNKKVGEKYKPAIKGENIFRYSIKYTGMFLNYDPPKLYNPVFPELFERESIIIRDIGGGKAINATINERHYYNPHTVINCLLKFTLSDIKKFSKKEIELSKNYNLKYLLGIINSKLVLFYFRTMITDFLHTVPDSVRMLPIKMTKADEQKSIIELVDKILYLNNYLNHLGNKKTDQILKIAEEIKKTDKEIDDLVYKIYGITEEEKKTIEESLK